ncbi:MAG TPA: S8 family peptidase, partial [Longimicrobium sp.]|nr:S8 family peptidase [Longimicrobium sp.]
WLPLSGGYTYQSGATGQGVNAYVVDSGIRFSHTQFGGRAVPAADFVAEAVSLNGNDCTGHGTHVAGILGGSTYGVAKGVKLHSVRVISCYNEAFMSAVVAGLEWVRVNHVKPAVVNMGFIGLYSLAQDDAVKTLLTAGVTVVSPAGNFNNDVCFYSSAYIDGVITAGATDANDARWPDSNWGYCIDVFAPGANIVSAAYYDDTDWTMLSGTSMAAPHVAGAVARYLQTRPTATPAETHAYIVNGATTGVVTDPGHLSPNRLLYVDPTLGGTPPSVTISGFSTISAAGTFTWQTSVTGGTGSYAYAWEYRVQGGAWTAAGTGSTYSRSVAAGDPAFELRVTVTSGSASASDNHLVAVNIPVPVAVSANITGPDYMMQGEFGTWYANASGGNGSYTYQWRYRLTSSTTWTNVGTGGSYYSRSAPLRSFYVGVTVTSGTSSVYSEYLVFVEQTTTTCGGTGTTMTYKCLEPMEPVPIN